MASVRVRTATGLFLAGLVVGGLFVADTAPPGLIPWICGFAMAFLAAIELGRMGALAGPRRVIVLPVLVALSALVVLVLNFRSPTPWQAVLWLTGIQIATLFTGALLAPFAPLGVQPGAQPADQPWTEPQPSILKGALGLGLLAAWVGPSMAGLAFLHGIFGTAALAALIVLSKFGDVAGYFVGKSIGKRHPFPSLSPGKTVAGCVASVVSGIVAGAGAAALGALPGDVGLLGGAVVGALLNLAAQAADLAESYVKRQAGVKDSSGMAGASGGILDVVDSLLFTIPVALLVFAFLVT